MSELMSTSEFVFNLHLCHFVQFSNTMACVSLSVLLPVKFISVTTAGLKGHKTVLPPSCHFLCLSPT